MTSEWAAANIVNALFKNKKKEARDLLALIVPACEAECLENKKEIIGVLVSAYTNPTLIKYWNMVQWAMRKK